MKEMGIVEKLEGKLVKIVYKNEKGKNKVAFGQVTLIDSNFIFLADKTLGTIGINMNQIVSIVQRKQNYSKEEESVISEIKKGDGNNDK